MDLLLLWLPSAILLEHEWEHGDHWDHSLSTQSVAQGISQTMTSGRGSSEQRWYGTSSPRANKTKQSKQREVWLASLSMLSITQSDFMSTIWPAVEEYATKEHTDSFRLESIIAEQPPKGFLLKIKIKTYNYWTYFPQHKLCRSL